MRFGGVSMIPGMSKRERRGFDLEDMCSLVFGSFAADVDLFGSTIMGTSRGLYSVQLRSWQLRPICLLNACLTGISFHLPVVTLCLTSPSWPVNIAQQCLFPSPSYHHIDIFLN